MIAFACPSCGMKFQVKDEYAGRASRCPTCKHLLTVPQHKQTLATVPPNQIDGAPSSVARAGLVDGVTLPQADVCPGQKPVGELLACRAPTGERYVIEGEIARGGMGAVLRAVDCDIRREVAVKVMLNEGDPAQTQRFVEEAQITGQLEHPNIVPIHELGVDAQKRFFFSMKMVKGKSLAQVLDGLRKDCRAAEKEWPLGRLLTVFVNICNALAYAHSRGVIHRDLKPANIMVGDFGEVYVMDWGLAKVLVPRGRGEDTCPGAQEDRRGRLSHEADATSATPSNKVVTSRAGNANLTRDGAIMGTPAYMPPEQAAGRIQDIDERSDVYSLGAILYELLTLQPPVGREGDYLAILMRVAQSEIVPPQQRDPQRTRAGKVPQELAAVAMKALAMRPEDRYPNIEALRSDVELFQEGRSVSAKRDTAREILWKLVKRNKAASLATAAALLVIAVILGLSIKLINDGRLEAVAERNRTQEVYTAYLQEQEAKRAQAKASVPVVLEAARFAVERRRFPEALAQANVAVDYDPDHAGARLLKARLLIAERDFPVARTELEKFLQLRPGDAQGTQLLELCRKARAEDTRSIAAIADALLSQDEVVLAAHLGRTRDQQLALYRKRIDTAWPKANLGKLLAMDKDGNCSLSIRNRSEITDLEPLRGIPLTRLWVNECAKLHDLAGLRNMPLISLDVVDCPEVVDLTALRGLKLQRFILLRNGPIQDLSPLKGMPLKSLALEPNRNKRWGANQLNVLREMPLTSLALFWQDVGSLSFLRDLPHLTHLELYSSWNWNLRALEGLKLKSLKLSNQTDNVRNLTSLASLPLERLYLENCNQLSDLTGLSKTLNRLDIHHCQRVKKFSPLAGLEKLKTIGLSWWGFLEPRKFPKEEIEVLRQMKSLERIEVREWSRRTGGAVTIHYTSAQFWKKYDAGGFGK